MLNFSPEKLVLVGIIALIVLGPNRLPQAARTLGKVLFEIRKVSGSFQTEVRDALAEPRDALSNAVGGLGLEDLRSSVSSVRDTMTGAVSPFTEAINPPNGPSAVTTPTSTGAVPPGPTPVPDDPSLN